MIGHRVNGCTIALAAPSTLTDAWAILAIRNGGPDGPGDEYVVASVYVHDIPTPDHWNNGYYTSDMNEALDEFSRKTSGVPMRRVLAQFMEIMGQRQVQEPSLTHGATVVQVWDSPVDEGFTTVQIDTTGEVNVNVDLNDGRLFHGNPNQVSNTFEVIRRAALAFLHSDDTGHVDLAELADALGVPHEDVEALSVRGCSCGMADYGAPGHDGHQED